MPISAQPTGRRLRSSSKPHTVPDWRLSLRSLAGGCSASPSLRQGTESPVPGSPRPALGTQSPVPAVPDRIWLGSGKNGQKRTRFGTNKVLMDCKVHIQRMVPSFPSFIVIPRHIPTKYQPISSIFTRVRASMTAFARGLSPSRRSVPHLDWGLSPQSPPVLCAPPGTECQSRRSASGLAGSASFTAALPVGG